VRTQRDVATHIIDLRDAHIDCKDRLGRLRVLIQEIGNDGQRQ
jgi:hypothetical protein